MIPLFRIIDKIIGSVLCVLLSIARLSKKQSEPHKILVIKLWAVGESILTLPMIACLRKKYPKADMSVLCRNRNKAVYEGKTNILLFEVNELPKLFFKYNSFDLVIDCEPYLNVSALLGWWLGRQMVGFSHCVRSLLYTSKIEYKDRQHVVQTYADMLDGPCNPTKLEPLNYTPEDARAAEQVLKQAGLKNEILIGMCQSVAESGKWRKWPSERYSELADRLIEKFGVKIALIGGQDTVENNELIRQKCKHADSVVNLGGKTTLKQLFALVKKFSLFISNDTGPMHIAAAQDVPTIGLFGPNLPTRFAPFGKGNIALYEKTWCSPCINVHKGNFPECFNKEKGLCMKQISIDAVFNAAQRFLIHKV